MSSAHLHKRLVTHVHLATPSCLSSVTPGTPQLGPDPSGPWTAPHVTTAWSALTPDPRPAAPNLALGSARAQGLGSAQGPPSFLPWVLPAASPSGSTFSIRVALAPPPPTVPSPEPVAGGQGPHGLATPPLGRARGLLSWPLLQRVGLVHVSRPPPCGLCHGPISFLPFPLRPASLPESGELSSALA